MRFLFLMAFCLLPFAARAVDNDSPLVIMDTPAKQVKAEAAPDKSEKPAEATKPAAPAETKVAPKPAGPVAAASAQAIIDDFPNWAVSKAGADTTGQGGDVPTTPENPPVPATPAAAAAPATPDVPKAPPAPASPSDKLWPRDTVPIFMRSCTGLHVELMAPCTCVIGKLMVAMPHDEFLSLTAANKIDEDTRVIDIRNKCLAAPGKHKED